MHVLFSLTPRMHVSLFGLRFRAIQYTEQAIFILNPFLPNFFHFTDAGVERSAYVPYVCDPKRSARACVRAYVHVPRLPGPGQNTQFPPQPHNLNNPSAQPCCLVDWLTALCVPCVQIQANFSALNQLSLQFYPKRYFDTTHTTYRYK